MGSLQSSAAAAMLSLAVSVPGISATASTGQPVAGWWLNLVPQVLLLDDDVIEEADPCSTGYEVRDLIGPAVYTTRFIPSALVMGLATSSALAGDVATPIARDASFSAENDAAMDRMMSAMHSAPTGDIDKDFVTMMVPHHQGAIDMAIAYLRYGTNERLRRLAQEIVVTQRDEIVAMQLTLEPATLPLHERHQHADHP